MKVPDLLIDGYNLMHYAGLARSTYGPGDLERCRNRLLKRLQRGLELAERQRAIVVFDAQYAPFPERTELLERGMRIIFSPSGQEADDVIEELIASHSAPRQLVVISSDHRLQRAARARKAAFVDSDQFLDELARRDARESSAAADEKPAASRRTVDLSEQELEEWLNVFDDVDIQQIDDDVRRETSSRARPAKDARRRPPNRTGSEPTSPTRGRSNQEPPPPSLSEPVVPEDLSFWEQRIAELQNEEDEFPAPDDSD